MTAEIEMTPASSSTNPVIPPPGSLAAPGGLSALWQWMPVVVLGIVWIGLLKQLRIEWSVNEQYGYGFVVPLLCLYLLWQRWPRMGANTTNPLSPTGAKGLLVIIAIFATFLFPLRLIQEANPDWRLVSWGMATVTVAISLAMIAYRRGRATATQVAFAIAFIFTAVPWPSLLENAITQSLMGLDVSVSVLFLQWFGVPALQQGNVLDLGTGFVGINEACSGIRSLQLSLMVSLFFGELYRFDIPRRCFVVLLAVATALILNIARTLSLAWLSVRLGTSGMEQWHDTIGLVMTLVSLVAVSGLATWMRPATPSPDPDAASTTNPDQRLRLWPRWFIALLVAWIALIEAGTEVWYRFHESNRMEPQKWSVRWPVNAEGYQDRPIPAATRAMLQFDEARSGVWSGENGASWFVFYSRWAPGRTATTRARSHRPDICLPAAGRTMEHDDGIQVYSVKGIAFPFRHYFFRESGKPLHVWYCVRDDQTVGAGSSDSLAEPLTDLNLVTRLKAVSQGRRNPGQRELEVALSGVENRSEAEIAFKQLLSHIVEQ